jgi:hypothetical protein
MRRLQVSIRLGCGNRGNSRTRYILKPQSEYVRATNIIKTNLEREVAMQSSKSSKCKRLLSFLGREECAALSAVLVLFIAVSARPAEGATLTTLYSFKGGGDGAYPIASLAFDGSSTLYGTTTGGAGTPGGNGPGGFGTVFQLTPAGATWNEIVLHVFTGGSDGGDPYSTLALGKDGSLYGTTSIGGLGYGMVFQLSPPTTTGGAWTFATLYSFRGGQ